MGTVVWENKEGGNNPTPTILQGRVPESISANPTQDSAPLRGPCPTGRGNPDLSKTKDQLRAPLAERSLFGLEDLVGWRL